MALNYQEVREQVKRLGENAQVRERTLQQLRDKACDLLKSNAQEFQHLQEKVSRVAKQYEATLRCAVPVDEPLDAGFSRPAMPAQATIIAVDGSQIVPDRNSPVEFCLINVGAITMQQGSSQPPETQMVSRLYYAEQLYTATGTITEDQLSLKRDLEERTMLVSLAQIHPQPAVTFTDGPMELWGAKDAGSGGADFSESLQAYQHVLTELAGLGAVTAGYVDKPAANLVVRLLEVAMQPEPELANIRDSHPLRGVTDRNLYADMLAPGERSAIFGMQSKSAKQYQGPLGLHFFYLNVGRSGHPWLARVEIPAWVAQDRQKLDILHAILVSQCEILGSRPYPYLLHRAHETALVTMEEKEQVIQMIALELRKRGVQVGEQSNKQAHKQLGGRTSFSS